MQYTFINDLFTTEEEMRHYLSHNFPYNLPLIKERLDAKLKDDPDYEVFVPFYYRKFDKKVKGEDSIRVINLPYLFISNKGRVISNNIVEEFREIPIQVHPLGYLNIFIAVKSKTNTVALHRAIACNFIPIKDCHLALGLHPKDLEVNHLNGDKEDYSIDNLEWSTQSENQTHAVLQELRPSGEKHKHTKSAKGVVVRGKFVGYSFVLSGGNHLESYGFDQAAVSNAISGNINSHGNCSWSFATEEDKATLPKEIPEDILKDIKETSPFVSFRYTGTCLTTGNVVIVIGSGGLKTAGFNPNAVRNHIKGGTKSSGGYSWVQEKIEY